MKCGLSTVEYPYFAGFLIFVNGYKGGGCIRKIGFLGNVDLVVWTGLKKKFFMELGSVANQLVTPANHLVDVNEMVHVFYGKIHAVIRQYSELVGIIFHNRADSGDYFPRSNICQ